MTYLCDVTAAFEELLDRVRTWSPTLQAEAERFLLALEDQHDDGEGALDKAFLESEEMAVRLKRAYEEGIASGPGEEIDPETFLASIKERAARRG